MAPRYIIGEGKTARPEPGRTGRVWCNANVRETINDPVSPLMWSIFEEHMFPGIMLDAFGLPLSRERYARFPGVERVLGRLYWNCNSCIAYSKSIGFLFNIFKADYAIDTQLARAMRSIDVKSIPAVIPAARMFFFSLVAGTRLGYYLLLSFFRYRWMARRVGRAFGALENLQAGLKISSDLTAACANVRTWLGYVTDRFARRYFGGLFLSIFYTMMLTRLMGIRLGKQGEVAARRSVIGIIDKTGEMVLAVNEMVKQARPQMRRITRPKLHRLYRTDPQFRRLFDRFTSEFGHRGPGEFDVATVNWAEDRNLIYDLVATSQDIDPRIEREPVIDELLKTLPSFERILLKIFMPRLEAFGPLRENGKHYYFRLGWRIKEQLLTIDRMLRASHHAPRPRDVFFLTLRDLETIAGHGLAPAQCRRLISQRKKEWEAFKKIDPPDIVYESGEQYYEPLVKKRVLSGDPLSFGRITGRARIIEHYRDSHRLCRGEILVTNHTDPGWTPLFNVASGVIIEVGGLACHAAMVARELGIPAIVVRGATRLIRDGQFVELDADQGTVELKTVRRRSRPG
jgi:phosphohistidine swiveling domain-containing protein